MADPWLKFFTSDWRSDPRLRMCGPAARGLWIDMICIMHEATPYGHLRVHGQPPNVAQLASLTGTPAAEIPDLLAELERFGVFSKTREGVIYSRKLVRMDAKSAKARKNGKKGGNPAITPKPQAIEDNDESDGRLTLKDNYPDKTQKPEARSQIEDSGGGGSARESDQANPPSTAIAVSVPDGFREHILDACGVDRISGLTGRGGSNIGTVIDMMRASRWINDLGLTEAEVIGEVRRLVQNKRDGPPNSFKFFDAAMQRLAGAKADAAVALKPIMTGQRDAQFDAMRRTEKQDRLSRIIGAAARGTTS